jgi:hypothetical protein
MAAGQRNPVIAGVLSGLVPGLGQFYNREWLKGAGFLVGLLVLEGMLGVSAEMMKALQGTPPANSGAFLLRSLAVLAFALWSIMDAVRTAKRQ